MHKKKYITKKTYAYTPKQLFKKKKILAFGNLPKKN
jgi:hypothetical protein